MKRQFVCTAVLAVMSAGPALAWNRSGDMDEIIMGPGATAQKIQAALDSLPKGGGTVALRPGVYIMDSPVSLNRDNLTLRGAGPATVLRLADKANCPLVVMGTLENVPSRMVSRLRVCDMALDGNRTNQEVECWATSGRDGSEIRNNCLTVRGVTDSSIERVECYRARSGGLVTEKNVWRLTVTDLTAWDNFYDGVAAYATEESVFTRMILRDNPGAGLSLDHKFNRNVVSDTVMAANGCGIFMRDSRENVFQGLLIRGSKEHGIFMAQAAVTNTIVLPSAETNDVTTAQAAANAPHQPTNGKGSGTGAVQNKTIVEMVMLPDTECTGNVFTGLQVIDCAGAGFLLNNDTCINNLIQAARFVRNGMGGLCESKPGLAKTHAILEQ